MRQLLDDAQLIAGGLLMTAGRKFTCYHYHYWLIIV
jgi:hypothetical protein